MKNTYALFNIEEEIKQIFVAIDKLSSYDEKAAQIIDRHKVL